MRYDWLDDCVDELVERYESGQSLHDIAEVFGVSTTPIHSRLKETDVNMRNGGRQYVKLADCVDELVEQHVKHDVTIQTLAARYETSVTAVRYHLECAGVNCGALNPRTTDVEFSPFQVSVIKGELLGDGCLYNRENGGCFFQLSTTTKAHAVRLIEKLPDGLFTETQPNSFTRMNQFSEQLYTMWTVTSRPQPFFAQLYEDWYEVRSIHNRKIVPTGYNLDQTALLHWYWGDGSCSIRDSGAPRVCFATNGFPEQSVRYLQAEVDKMGYDNYTVLEKRTEDGSGLMIRLRDYDARSFLSDLRPLNTLPQYDRKFPVPIHDETID